MKATEMPPLRLLRAEEVAKMLGCSKWYVYALAERGELPCIRIGRTVRFEYKAVEEFVNQRRPGKGVPCEHPQEREKLPDRLLLQGKTVQGVDRPLQEGGGSRPRETAERNPRREVLRQGEA